MIEEHENMCKEILRRVLFHAHRDADDPSGWRSQFVATFTEDELNTIRNIVNDTTRTL